jgi:mRNA interferase RelE/StbE
VTYRVLIDARAARELEGLPKSVVTKIDAVILSLATNPRPAGTKRLKGKLKEGWRVRVGAYRILYRIDDEKLEVRIFEVGHRREVYR